MKLEEIDFDEFIDKLEVKIPSGKEFQKLGDSTALFRDKQGNFVRLNYERGILLYALVAKHKPKNILEFGTASGYGTLCMAWAMADHDIDGKIFTIDIESMEKTTIKPIDLGNGPSNVSTSRKEIWDKVGKKEWFKHIKSLTGYSAEIMSKEILPKIQFAYIDGPHFFDGVRHDFYSFLKVADDRFCVLFDDYIDRPFYGVKKLIDTEISNFFDPILIHSDKQEDILKMKMTSDSKYGMCWIDSESLKCPIDSAYNKTYLNEQIKKYQKFEKRLKFRNSINEKIPFLKKIRFQSNKNKN